ncbi:helix-turn-helix domain-containing protein [Pseudomonas nitroreducens]|uniref:helix-turn-helix domain-containing protein n=1 Tax=Pseudomonas nitroreducens TaxID=46680 RepID=UPI003D2CC056
MDISETATEAQRARLLNRVMDGPVDTLTARTELNILHPAARIQELRERGYPIKTYLITKTDEHGRKHQRVALYYLGTLPQGEGRAVA